MFMHFFPPVLQPVRPRFGSVARLRVQLCVLSVKEIQSRFSLQLQFSPYVRQRGKVDTANLPRLSLRPVSVPGTIALVLLFFQDCRCRSCKLAGTAPLSLPDSLVSAPHIGVFKKLIDRLHSLSLSSSLVFPIVGSGEG